MYLFIYKFNTIKTKIKQKRGPLIILVIPLCSLFKQVYSHESFINTVSQSLGLIHVPIRHELACPFSQIQMALIKLSVEEYSIAMNLQ